MVLQSQRSAETPSQSHTQVITEERHIQLVGDSPQPRNEQHVSWTEETIDNEHLGRKKSKICCIYHPPEDLESEGEDVSSESSSSSSDSDSGSDNDQINGRTGQPGPSCSSHRHCHHNNRRKGRPNAYERQPKLPSRGP